MAYKSKLDQIYIDIDLPFEFFMDNLREIWLEVLHYLEQKGIIKVRHYIIKKSTNGNTHIFIKLGEPLKDYKELIILSAMLMNDPKLISIAYMRYKAFGDPLIKLFDIKVRKRG